MKDQQSILVTNFQPVTEPPVEFDITKSILLKQ